ncbi:nitronate monooxygenase [Streptomyces durmitorensis]
MGGTEAGGPEAGRALPRIIQGGMGVGVSDWRLARAVSRAGQLGVVSGTALDAVLARRLQLGDPDGDVRRALAAFPVPELAAEVIDRFYVEGGIGERERFRTVPMLRAERGRPAELLTMLGNFVEVWLAKEGHEGRAGINYLGKVELGLAPALFGAILAGVDCVLVGAGVPGHVPELASRLARAEPVTVAVTVEGDDEAYAHPFDPRAALTGGGAPAEEARCDGGSGRGARRVQDVQIDGLRAGPTSTPLSTKGVADSAVTGLRRPDVLAIVSLPVLASYLARDEVTRPDGFVIETHGAGGHSAPPRGRLRLDPDGDPVYGPRDHPDLARMAALGIPFWLAGGTAHPDRLAAASAAGATGVQIGSAFALSEDSGLDPDLRGELTERAHAGALAVRNDPLASPTGFPFKVAKLPGTLSDPGVIAGRRRVCDLGYLRTPYRTPKGTIGYRCPAEPEAEYLRKGGDPAATEGRLCLCNGLLATVGLGQRRPHGGVEPLIATLGQDLGFLAELSPDGAPYGAVDVVRWLLGSAKEPS